MDDINELLANYERAINDCVVGKDSKDFYMLVIRKENARNKLTDAIANALNVEQSTTDNK